MTPADFRHVALAFPGAEESSHMGAADFRVGGHIFATLAHEHLRYGNLTLTPAQQANFLAEAPYLFLPVAGGWGRSGMTHIRLAEADELSLTGAVHTAWKNRIERNEAARKSGPRRK